VRGERKGTACEDSLGGATVVIPGSYVVFQIADVAAPQAVPAHPQSKHNGVQGDVELSARRGAHRRRGAGEGRGATSDNGALMRRLMSPVAGLWFLRPSGPIRSHGPHVGKV